VASVLGFILHPRIQSMRMGNLVELPHHMYMFWSNTVQAWHPDSGHDYRYLIDRIPALDTASHQPIVLSVDHKITGLFPNEIVRHCWWIFMTAS